MLKLIVAIMATSILLFSQTSSAKCVAGEERIVVFGLTPWLSPDVTSLWLNKIEKQLRNSQCIKFKYQSASDFESYVRNGINGQYDILNAPPHIASYLMNHHQFRIVAREALEGQAIIIKLKSTNISSLDQLNHRKLAVPDPLAVVTLLAKEAFNKPNHTINPDYIYYQHHNEVVHAVMAGEMDAGVIFSPIYETYKKHSDDNLQILHTFPPYIDGWVIASGKLPTQLVLDIQATLVALQSEDKGIWAPWLRVSPAALQSLHDTFRQSAEYLELFLSSPTHAN